MKNMKKIAGLILALAMVFALAGCDLGSATEANVSEKKYEVVYLEDGSAMTTPDGKVVYQEVMEATKDKTYEAVTNEDGSVVTTPEGDQVRQQVTSAAKEKKYEVVYLEDGSAMTTPDGKVVYQEATE